MEYTVTERSFPSTDGKHILRGVVYMPTGEKKAIIHVVHGMCEYIGRYDRFMGYMASLGYVCCGYNHVGHKGTSDDSELGFIAEDKGYGVLTEDVYSFGCEMKKENPDLKYILMGHSMGSFVVRLCAAKHPDYLDALIIMGTGGANPAAGIGVALTSLMKKLGRCRKVSPLVYAMAFGSYNKKTDNRTECDWITRDESIVDVYRKDKYCTFRFTNSAMNDLIRMNRDSNRSECIAAYPCDLPILLVSGDNDPVGDYGVGVEKVYSEMVKQGKTNIKLKLYPDMRHEVLNEIGKEEVEKDIAEWCDGVI